MKQKALKYGLFLCILGVIVGVLLSVVNAITKPIIDKQEEDKVNAMLSEYDSELEWKEVTNELNNNDSNILAIYLGSKDQKDVYAYKVVGYGYGNGEINTMVYIENGIIKSIKVVSTNGQTKGVGSKVEEDNYLSVYKDKLVSDYAGINPQSHNNKSVDVISGATISSRGVISAVSTACTHYNNEVAK